LKEKARVMYNRVKEGGGVKILFVYESVHHGNTEKIVHAMSGECGGAVLKAREFHPSLSGDYECMGFGSGIFFGKFHSAVERAVGLLPPGEGRPVFVFSTSGRGIKRYNRRLTASLEEKGYHLLGDFSCKGYDTYGPLKWLGGIARGRPGEQEISQARQFIRMVMGRRIL
jgi:flavodoxin